LAHLVYFVVVFNLDDLLDFTFNDLLNDLLDFDFNFNLFDNFFDNFNWDLDKLVYFYDNFKYALYFFWGTIL
jgi:hypothetical protein